MAYKIQINQLFLQVSLSSNFGKPLLTPEPSAAKVDDIFSGFSFSSPLTDVIDDNFNDSSEDIESIKLNLAKLSVSSHSKTIAQNSFSNCSNDNIDNDEDVPNNNSNNSNCLMEDIKNYDNEAQPLILGARPKQSMTMDIRCNDTIYFPGIIVCLT